MLQRKGCVSLFPLTAIVSGVEKRGKTAALQYFLSQVIRTDDDMKETSFFESQSQLDTQCLSCYKAMILGKYPFDDLTWLMSIAESDNAITCLMSYFASLCKGRDLSPQTDYYRLLEFAPVPTTSENINISDPDIADQMKHLYAKLVEHWDRLIKDKDVRDIMPTGVCLLNIFDVGPCKAAQDLLPFINKYCKHTVNFACYDSIKDGGTLEKEFSEDTTDHYQSLRYQLMRQLCGINKDKEKMVALTAIDATEGNKKQEVELTQALREAVGVDKVYHLRVSEKNFKETKSTLEENVLQASFYAETPLSYLLLLHLVQTKCKSFWMKRSDIELFAKKYNLQNGDLETFLRFFTSFGSIFYTHDIPTLKEYVIIDIVKFVRCIHQIYHSPEETASYGLFEERDDLEGRIVFSYLTTLGIATELKSNQIVPEHLPILKMMTTYFFIPTARNVKLGGTSATTTLLMLKGYTKENLQARLSKCLLQSKKRLFIPTKAVNSMAIRFTIDGKDKDIEFIDEGNKVMIRLLSHEHVFAKQEIDEISDNILKMCPFFEANTEIQRQGFIEACAHDHLKIKSKDMKELAKKITEQHQEKKKMLSSRLGIEQEWHNADKEDYEEIMFMLLDFERSNGTQKLITILNELDIPIH